MMRSDSAALRRPASGDAEAVNPGRRLVQRNKKRRRRVDYPAEPLSLPNGPHSPDFDGPYKD